ncbi:DUF4279 domain-containing protein [Tsukamurella ocularis]|uniref:DUF4279 domain-containing protein n=1 Tax=Tsukamurella ocularis TaxID=1970234 RepID=UPI00216A6A17|nr:DUF4279 domain-containing protein [Tsukamurella ocularis]MCS3781313.1 hypothetical protein [Tsukamurella ocularis]MCS3787684.1 hypothetical protein [Tsukamurella ocularis]MCS3850979.1 hypothetical protein [Tsukamurella ocularis]
MPPVHRAIASLQLSGVALDPSVITRILGTLPTLSYARGDLVPAGSGTRTARFGLWSLAAEDTEPADIDTQVTHLLSGLPADLGVWRELSDRYALRLFCGWFLQGGNEGVVLSATTLAALGERGIALDLDIYSAPLRFDDSV